ncbi:MAG: FecR domain-containing protein [Burkholderiaceae bacterium]
MSRAVRFGRPAVGGRAGARGPALGMALGCLVAALACPGAVAQAQAQQRPPEAGRVASADGETMLLRDGAVSMPIKVGESVRSGDILRTAAQARVQLRMVDGGLVAIEPRSEFQVASYRFDEQQQRSFLKLVRGAVRMVSGAIGKRDPDDFRMTTPTATIGIRGTEFIARESDCQGADCSAGERPGLTVSVLQGRVVVSSPAVGELDVPAGRTVYVAAVGLVPPAPVLPRAPSAPSWSPSPVTPPAAPLPPAPAPRQHPAPAGGEQPELLGGPRSESRPAPLVSAASGVRDEASTMSAASTLRRGSAATASGSASTAAASAALADDPARDGVPVSDLFDEPDSFTRRTHHPPALPR